MGNDEVCDGSDASGGGGTGGSWSIDNDAAGGAPDGFNSREIGGGGSSMLSKINMTC